MNASTDYIIMNENNGDNMQPQYKNQYLHGPASPLPQPDYDIMHSMQAQQAKRGSLVLPKAPKTIIKKKGMQ